MIAFKGHLARTISLARVLDPPPPPQQPQRQAAPEHVATASRPSVSKLQLAHHLDEVDLLKQVSSRSTFEQVSSTVDLPAQLEQAAKAVTCLLVGPVL